MSEQIVHIGIDIHQGRLVWCAVDSRGEVLRRGSAWARPAAAVKLARQWLKQYGVVCSYYEAGPCG